MIQEIITYFIIGVAVTAAFYKFREKFGKKKKVSKLKSGTCSSIEKCTDCPAECILRDSANSLNNNGPSQSRKKETSKT